MSVSGKEIVGPTEEEEELIEEKHQEKKRRVVVVLTAIDLIYTLPLGEEENTKRETIGRRDRLVAHVL